jgi:sarcosine oxidase, subunit beta
VTSAPPKTAIVVGGGVVGLSIARELARCGVATTLYEKRRFGAGSSGKSGAILRAFYPAVELAKPAREGREAYAALPVETGVDVGFRRTGALFIGSKAHERALRDGAAALDAVGLKAEILNAAAMRRLEPRIRVEDDALGVFEPDAAFVDPGATIAALAEAARRAGAKLEEGVGVDGFVRDLGRVVGVAIGGDSRRADAIVLATNAWTTPLLSTVGPPPPIRAVRPEQAYFEPPRDFGKPAPIVADFVGDAYYKDEGGRGVRAGRLGFEDDPEVDPDAYDEGVSGAFVAFARAALARRFPAFRDATSWGGCGALYATTPDAQALIGPAVGVDGVFLAAGFSGHGFKLAPAVGRGVAEILVDGATDAIDAAFFDPRRFALGRGRRPVSDRPILG